MRNQNPPSLPIVDDISALYMMVITIQDNIITNDHFGKDPKRIFTYSQKKQMLKIQLNICSTFDDNKCIKNITIYNSQADHVIKHSDKGPTTLLNGQMLCIPCHAEKTKTQR